MPDDAPVTVPVIVRSCIGASKGTINPIPGCCAAGGMVSGTKPLGELIVNRYDVPGSTTTSKPVAVAVGAGPGVAVPVTAVSIVDPARAASGVTVIRNVA